MAAYAIVNGRPWRSEADYEADQRTLAERVKRFCEHILASDRRLELVFVHEAQEAMHGWCDARWPEKLYVNLARVKDDEGAVRTVSHESFHSVSYRRYPNWTSEFDEGEARVFERQVVDAWRTGAIP